MGRSGGWLSGISLTWRKFLAWMAIAIALGAVSVFLTMQITEVEGRSPLDMLNSRMGDESESAPLKEDFHGQFISVLTPKAASHADPVDIIYYTRTFGALDAGPKSLASIQFTVVENQPVKLIFSHLKESADVPHCLASGRPSDAIWLKPDEAGSYWLNPRIIKAGKRRFAEITFPAFDDGVTIVCGVVPDVLRQTFTARAMRFSFFEPGAPLIMDASSTASGETFPDPKGVYKDYRAAESIPIMFNLNGVEGLSFEGGRPNMDSDDYDRSRRVKSWGWTEVSWEETPRKQQRDILLIIIGTIIAIAVTALIEAARPFIEGGLEPRLSEGGERPNRYRPRRERPDAKRKKVRPF